MGFLTALWNGVKNVAGLGPPPRKPAALPLCLALGRPEGPEDTTGEDKACKAEELLFNQAAQLNLVIRQAPQGSGTPIHVYASREAVFVTCAGASLLGRQAAVLSGDVEV